MNWANKMIGTVWVTSSRVVQGIVKQIPQFLVLPAINKYVVLTSTPVYVFVAWYLGIYLTLYI